MTTKPLVRRDVHESHWPASAAIILLLAFIALLPERYGALPGWARPWMLALVVAFAVISALPRANPRTRRVANAATVLVIVLVTAWLVLAVTSVILQIYEQGVTVRGMPVLSTTVALWTANIVVFALWYWLVDRGGPDRRASGDPGPFDLLFVQNATRDLFTHGWTPRFADYVFVAFVTSTAFSPADTLPVTRRAKLLMMAQAVLSLAIVVMLVGRAINVMR